jgi:phospholipid/cholesterol/gamma-HCH transport system permease protein
MNEAALFFDNDAQIVRCTGNWTLAGIEALTFRQGKLNMPEGMKLAVCCDDVEKMDSAGALLLHRFINKLTQKGNTLSDVIASEKVTKLLTLIAKKTHGESVPSKGNKYSRDFLFFVGEETHRKIKQCDGFIILIGELVVRFFYAITHPKRFEFPSILRIIELSGFQALPILALLSFLVGVVLAYQMGIQLETYGANIYIVYFTGVANLREFSPLITAIIVAGRSSSSFTAQIGSMKINEEIDALSTMGLAPIELLIMPKIIGMFLAFPLLVFWSDLFSTFGSMVMAKFMLDVHYIDYINRFKETLGVKQYLLGLSKAPVFSLLIALVGCYQGLQVKGSSESIGLLTTKSVVQSIFLIIIADAGFSMLFSWLKV